jgi:hypothetical protein
MFLVIMPRGWECPFCGHAASIEREGTFTSQGARSFECDSPETAAVELGLGASGWTVHAGL